MSKEQQTQHTTKKPPQRPSPVQETTPVAELTPAQTGLQNPDQLPGLPVHPTARPIRQATVLRMQQQQGNTAVQRLLTRAARHNGHNHTASTAETESDQSQEFVGAGAPTLTSAPPPDAPDTGPNGSHPAASPPAIQREEDGGEDDTPTEAEKAAALAAAQEAEAQANQSATEAHQEVDKSQTAKETEKQASNTAQDKTNQAKEEAKAIATNGATAVNGAAPPASPKAPTAKQSANGAGGDTVAPPTPTPGDKGPDYIAPKSPAEDPAFQGVGGRVKKVAAGEKDHAPATAKADEAAAAAEMPANETEARAQNNQAGAMESAETPPFDAAAFKARLMQRIQELAPKNAAEADNFKESNKLDGMKGEMNNQVAAEKEKSKTPMAEAANAAPDTSAVPPKSVTPIPEAQPGDMPPPVGAEQAAPKQHGTGEVEQPLAESSQSLDDKMAEAEITEDQLANANEPEFTAALDSKEEAQTHAKEAPVEVRTTEQEHITNAEAEATAVAQEHTQAMHTDRTDLLGQVEGRQDVAKSEDEQARQKIAADINRIYDDTKTKVEGILERLDGEVERVFSEGAEAAKKAFEDYVDAKMEAYKQERYGGWFGWARWVKDKLAGMPSEVNVFYTEGRNLFLSKMDAVIDNVVAIIGRGMAEAKAEIANGRKQIQDYIAQLPEDLQSVGQEAAETIQSKFNSLEESVDNKQNELIDTLANKYQEHLQAVDARIEEMKAANAGLIDKAINAIVGVIKIILELKNLLLSVLSSAADAVMAIIKDPIGFIGNLISAIGQGLNNFVDNILTHLKTGFIEWLTGTLGGAGIQMPADIFSLEGVFDLVLQILGLTWESIRARAVRLLGEPVVKALETTFEIFMIIKEQGLAGLWQYIQDQISNLKEIVIEGIQEMLITEVIEAGIQWLIGILGGPAGAFIKAAKAIIDIVLWFVNNAQRIASLLQSIMQSVTAIASGNLSAAAQYVEDSLARFIPTAIGFLASLLGIGDLAQKVRKIIDKVQEPINAAIDWVLEQARKVARRIGKALGLVSDDEAGDKPGDGKTGDGEVGETVAFNAGGEGHRLWYNVQGTAVTVMVASETTPLEAKIAQWETSLQSNAEMMGEDANRARTLINTAKNMLGLTQSAGEEAAREKEEADKAPGDDRQEAEFETADNQAEEAEQNLADVLAQLFTIFGEEVEDIETGKVKQAYVQGAQNVQWGQSPEIVQRMPLFIKDAGRLKRHTLAETESLVSQVASALGIPKKTPLGDPNPDYQDMENTLYRLHEENRSFNDLAELTQAVEAGLETRRKVRAVDWDAGNVQDVHPEREEFLNIFATFTSSATADAAWNLTIRGIQQQRQQNIANRKHDPNQYYADLANQIASYLAGVSPLALWSGGIAVSLYARSLGYTTLESTQAGKVYDGLKLFENFSTLGPLWNNLSRQFVRNMTGEVHVFMRVYDPSSVLFRQELPELSPMIGAQVSRVRWHILRNWSHADLTEVDNRGNPSPSYTFNSYEEAVQVLEASTIRDESGKSVTASEADAIKAQLRQQLLTNLPHIGEARANAVLAAFPTMEQLRTASLDDLMAVRGIGTATAQRIYNLFH